MSDTESADEVVQALLNPPKKCVKKKHLDVETKESVLYIYEHELKANPDLVLSEIQKIVADKVGVSQTSVYSIIKEYKTHQKFSPRKTYKGRKKLVNSLSDFDKSAIRRKVYQYIFRNEVPKIDSVLRDVNDDNNLPNFKRSTFYTTLKSLNFKSHKIKSTCSSLIVDKSEIILWRRRYLEKIRQFREENRKIYYLGETWINADHKIKEWVDASEAVVDGSKEVKKASSTSGKEKRLVICHIGNEDGFVPGAQWVFESTKTGDLQEYIDGESFERWFEKMLPTLEDNAVIVMENASHHCRKVEKMPGMTTKKSDIEDWLRSKNISFEKSLLKVELLEIIKKHKNDFNTFIIDKLAKNSNNKIVLRLPPYHCELNPIGLVYAHIKNSIAANKTLTFTDLNNLFDIAMSLVSVEKWKSCIRYVQEKEEPTMWELDNLIEAHTESLEDSESTSDSE